ncbi:hypothetical protein, partial [Croceicoccus bisphenolivorans]|uniref:hypothetical protein n=1 Tax=Croceicoccus bisphenolivorans TaxID=1783232 RepID=UPI00156119BE
MSSLPGGGFAVHWLADSNADGDGDTLAIQRYLADGSKDGGVVTLTLSDQLTNADGVEGFDLTALDNGGYALSYEVELETYGEFMTLGNPPLQTVSIVGRPSEIFVGNTDATFQLRGFAANGSPITITLDVVDGVISLGEGFFDQFGYDDRFTLIVSNPSAPFDLFITSTQTATYTSDNPLTEVDVTAASGPSPVPGASQAILSSLDGRVEAFHIESATPASGQTVGYTLVVNPLGDADAFASATGGNLFSGGLVLYGGLTPDANGDIFVPQNVLDALGDQDAGIALLVNGLEPGSSVTGSVTYREGTDLPEGIFVETYDADG